MLSVIMAFVATILGIVIFMIVTIEWLVAISVWLKYGWEANEGIIGHFSFKRKERNEMYFGAIFCIILLLIHMFTTQAPMIQAMTIQIFLIIIQPFRIRIEKEQESE